MFMSGVFMCICYYYVVVSRPAPVMLKNLAVPVFTVRDTYCEDRSCV